MESKMGLKTDFRAFKSKFYNFMHSDFEHPYYVF